MEIENWQQEYKSMKQLSRRQIELLDNGPDSLAASWFLQAMWIDYKRRKGIKEDPPPNCQSSLKEFYKKQTEVSNGL